MKNLTAYEVDFPFADVFPMPPGRDWMEKNPTSYFCMPVSISNKLGWAVALKGDVTFIFHGRDKYPNDSGIEILEGAEHCYLERGEGIIAFLTGLSFESDDMTSLLTLPVPNQFIDGTYCFTTVISSSFFTAGLQVVWMITKRGEPITIKAGTPLAVLLPIDAEELNNSKLTIKSLKSAKGKIWHHGPEYSDAMSEYVKKHQKATGWYKNAVNHLGKVIGRHQAQSFNFKVERE